MLLLIADDDRLARYSLKSMLHDLDDGTFMIFEATNGKTLVEQCRRLHPDVAFVDISMPHMDGLTAIEQCRQCSEDTQFVVVSGHSEFDYAKKSITLQVADYLVKPAEPKQLEALLKRLSQRLAHTRRNLNMDFQVKVLENCLLWEEIGYCKLTDPCAGQQGAYCAFAFFLDTRPGKANYAKAYLSMQENLNTVIQECADRRIRAVLRDSRQACFELIIHCDDKEFPTLCSRVERLCRGLEYDDAAVTCFCTRGVDLWQLFKNTTDAEEMDYLRFGLPGGRLCFFPDLPFTAQEHELLSAANALVTAFQDADEALYLKALGQMKAVQLRSPSALDTGRLAALLSLCLNGSFSWTDLPGLCRQLAAHKKQLYLEAGAERTDKMTYAMEYIAKHYMQDISVAQLASRLEMTPNYFSKLFHDRTGQTFSSYLTAQRMNQAKRILLTRQDVLVKDVAMMVGYFSSRHFADVFKKMTGLSPSEFREQGQD